MANGQLSLGKAICGWQQHLPELDAFACVCESDTKETVSLTLTDGTYICVACFAIGGCYKHLDAATFKRWESLCPRKCSYEPEHRGSPCLLVHAGHGKGNVSRLQQYTTASLQLSGVAALLWLSSLWTRRATNTPGAVSCCCARVSFGDSPDGHKLFRVSAPITPPKQTAKYQVETESRETTGL